jgi:uncharacterized protein YoxC
MPDVTITLTTIDKSSGVVKNVNKEFKSLAPGLEKITGNIKGFASANAGLISVMGGVAAGAVVVGKAIYASAKAYEESARQQAKLNAVLKSTKEAAGLNSDALMDMADALARVNGLDDELVTSGEAVLLTFTKIKSDAFEPAMQAAIDMSAVLGGDLQGSIIQVGKAMNDFSGYTALKRAGVSFTSEQIAQIENFKDTNNLIGYQNLLLNELQTEFGGAAKSMKEAGLGGEAVSLAWGNLTEEIGEMNAEWIQDFNRGLSYTLDSFADWIDQMNNAANQTESSIDTYEKFTDTNDKLKTGLFATLNTSADLNENFKAFEAQMRQGAAATEFYKNRQQELSQSFEKTEEELKAVSDGYSEQWSIIQNVQAETERFTQKNQELTDKLADLEAQQAKLKKGSTAYKEMGEKIGDVKGEMDALAEEHEKASKKIIFDLFILKAASDGWQEGEFENAIQIAESMGIISKETAKTAKLMIAEANRMVAGIQPVAGAVDSILDSWRNLYEESKTKKVQLVATVSNSGAVEADATVNITPTGNPNDVYNNGGVGQQWTGGNVGRGVASMADGGYRAGWALVGDKQGGGFIKGVSELVYGNAKVFNSKESENMLRSGRFGRVKGLATGGSVRSVKGTGKYLPGSLGGGSGGSGSLEEAPAEVAAIAPILDMQEAQAALTSMQINSIQTQINNLAQSIQNLQMGLTAAVYDLGNVMRHENPRAIVKGMAVEVDRLKK